MPLACLLLIIASLVLGWRAAGHGRRAADRRPTVLAAAAFGVAVVLVVLLISMFRHYGGEQQEGDGGSGYACAAWWYQIGTPQGATGGDDAPSPACRRAAGHAVGPALIESAGVGVVSGIAIYAVLMRRRRRFDVALARLATRADEPI